MLKDFIEFSENLLFDSINCIKLYSLIQFEGVLR